MSQEENSKQITLEQKIQSAHEEEEKEEEEEEVEVEQDKEQKKGEEGEAEEVEEEEVEVEVEEKKKKKPPKNGLISIKRRKSLYEGFDEKQELFRPEFRFDETDKSKEIMWGLMDTYIHRKAYRIYLSYYKI